MRNTDFEKNHSSTSMCEGAFQICGAYKYVPHRAIKKWKPQNKDGIYSHTFFYVLVIPEQLTLPSVCKSGNFIANAKKKVHNFEGQFLELQSQMIHLLPFSHSRSLFPIQESIDIETGKSSFPLAHFQINWNGFTC